MCDVLNMFYDLMVYSNVYVESKLENNVVVFGESRSKQAQLIIFQ